MRCLPANEKIPDEPMQWACPVCNDDDSQWQPFDPRNSNADFQLFCHINTSSYYSELLNTHWQTKQDMLAVLNQYSTFENMLLVEEMTLKKISKMTSVSETQLVEWNTHIDGIYVGCTLKKSSTVFWKV